MSKIVSITNKKNKKLIGSHIKVAKNPISRMIGLLTKSSLPEGTGLLIVPCRSIHSFFMKFEFDAVFLDKNDMVTYLIEEMKPFKVSKYAGKAKKVLELPAKAIKKYDITFGDTLEIIENNEN
mgnify:CR=1 FL=1